MARWGYTLYALLGAAAAVYALYALGAVVLYAGRYFQHSVRPLAPLGFAAHMFAIALGCFAVGRLLRYVLAGT